MKYGEYYWCFMMKQVRNIDSLVCLMFYWRIQLYIDMYVHIRTLHRGSARMELGLLVIGWELNFMQNKNSYYINIYFFY